MFNAEKIRNFLAKLQNLPEHKKKIILWTVVVILGVIMGFFWVKGFMGSLPGIENSIKLIKLPVVNNLQVNIPSIPDQTAGWNVYKNNKYSFEIKYPSDWNFREYDTGTGAALFPKSDPNVQGSISIGFYGRGADYCKIPFGDYVKIAGPSEIQNYESLDTIEEGVSINGVDMYETTWHYTDMQGNGKVSLPITYFEANPELCGGIEAFLNDNKYIDTYNKIISSFKK